MDHSSANCNQPFEAEFNIFQFRTSAPVWPDVGIKSSQIFSKTCKKVAKTVFTYKVTFFKKAPKLHNIWATFVRKFAVKSGRTGCQGRSLVAVLPSGHFLSHRYSKSYIMSASKAEGRTRAINVLVLFHRLYRYLYWKAYLSLLPLPPT